MKAKRVIAAVLASVMTFSQILANVPTAAAVSADVQSDTVFNCEGVWLTEIYQNDVNRSKDTSEKRKANGYEEILTFDSTDDLMEFVEITSTHEDDISLNETYEFFYNDTKITVTDMDGDADVTIEEGQAVVLWNYRSDLGITLPTEEEFRSEMRVPDDALVLKAVTGDAGGNWEANGCVFSIRTKDGAEVSAFAIPSATNIYTQDGFSVQLQIPDLGSQMLVYREQTAPSAGYISSHQLNGLVSTKGTDEVVDGVYITEVRPNDINRCATYGSSVDQDLMECLEIVNTTNEDVVLNEDYVLKYFVKEDSRKVLPLYHYDETTEDGIGSSEDCVVPAGSAAVLWCYRIRSFPADTLSTFTSFPTEADFRAAYGISEEVPVYLFINQNGLGNTNRGFEIYDDEDQLVSSYIWVGSTDCKDNTSAILAVNPEGPEMLLSTANGATSMGTVNESQITFLQDDGSALELRLAEAADTFAQEDAVIPESVNQGEEIRVNFYYAVTGSLPKTGLATYYRFDGEGEWTKSVEGGARIPNLYESIISADELFDHDYVEFYVKASNAYRSALCGPYTVRINKLNDVDGVRTNISEGEQVGGTVSITANDGGDNANSEIYVDGVKQETVPMLEDGAYFSFYADGRDSYFKNAITTTEDEWITAIGKWQYAISNGQAHHIDNCYFTYNQETGSFDVTLRFWAGTYGATVDEYLYPEGNREDFKVSQLALKLANGNTYYPTEIGPSEFEGVDTSAKTNLSTDYSAVHAIGDSAKMCPYMDVSFSIPASEVTAVGVQIDTTTLSEGNHTLKVTSGDSTTEVNFVVDNTAPTVALGVADDDVLTGAITLAPQVEDGLENVICVLDGEEIEIPYETTAYVLGEGEHVLTIYAEDAAGNYTTSTATFTVDGVSIALDEAGTTDITDTSAKLYLSAQSAAGAEATFYEVKKIDAAQISTNTVSGILPYIRYTLDVGNVSADTLLKTSWDGTASGIDDTHATTMFVLNTATDTWDEVGTADSEGSIEASFAAKNHVKNGVATVIVQCTADSALPDLDTATDGVLDTNADWNGTSVPEDYDFSFAWITDTQYYAEQWQYHFLNMNNYIVDNAEDLKIKYVIHTGDIVDDWDMIYEWENADEAMSILDEAGMPYGVLGGNHDVAAGLGDNENYYTYFGEDRFTSQATYGGSYLNNLGHYDLISENGQDFVIVYMSWNIYQEEIDWMNQILAQYSDRKAILCFHPHTNVKESDDGLLDYYGVLIQKEVVAKNANVFAVLNGHYHGSSYQTVMFDDDNDGVSERTVYQICTDYQSGFEGGSEYIKFLYFDLDNDKVYINAYSPYFNDFNYYDGTGVDKLGTLAAESETGVIYKTGIDTIVLDVNFNTDEQSILADSFSAYVCTNEELGSASVEAETGVAKLELTGLEAETEYAWYAVLSNDNTGCLETGVYEFATVAAAEEKVIDLINVIGDVTLDSDDAIDAAREAYDALTAEQKALVENYQDLLDAERAFAELKQANAEAAADSSAAAQTAAEEARGAYEEAQAAADQAKTAAEAAAAEQAEDKTAAENAAKMAQKAQNQADAAEAAYEEAQTAAAEAALAAEVADADAAAKAAESTQAAAQTAKNASDAAVSAAEAAEACRNAQQIQADAEAALKTAEEAKAAAAAAQLALDKYNALTELDKYIASEITTDEEAKTAAEAVKAAREAINKAESAEEVAAALEKGKAAVDAADCPSEKYVDVAADAWYHEAVDFMVANGYMEGTKDTYFDVKGNLTRAQLVTILYRIEGEPEVAGLENPFDDVAAGKWYTNAVIWAADAGVVKGIDENTFAPNTDITREQLVTILFRYAKAEAVEKDYLAAYADGTQVRAYAAEAMNWAVANGVVNGVTKDTLVPNATATRAQVSTILSRYLHN